MVFHQGIRLAVLDSVRSVSHFLLCALETTRPMLSLIVMIMSRLHKFTAVGKKTYANKTSEGKLLNILTYRYVQGGNFSCKSPHHGTTFSLQHRIMRSRGMGRQLSNTNATSSIWPNDLLYLWRHNITRS